MPKQHTASGPSRPSGLTPPWSKRDEQQHNMLHISWLKGESRWQAKIPYKNAFGLTEHLLRKRGGPKCDPRLALAELIVVRDKVLFDMAKGRDVSEIMAASKGMTLAQWVNVYLSSATELSAKTRENYEGLLAWAVRDLGHIQLTLLTETQIAQWVVKMTQEADDPEVRFGISTVVMALKRLKTCLEVAVKRRAETGLEVNYAHRVSVTREARRRSVNKLAEYTTHPSETRRLFEACWVLDRGQRKQSYLGALILLATDAGMRRSEIAGLFWGDLDLDSANPTITFRRHVVTAGKDKLRKSKFVPGSKTSQGKYAELRISPPVAQALREAKVLLIEHKLAARASWKTDTVGRCDYKVPSAPAAPDSLVFPKADGSVWEPAELGMWFSRICKRAGITTKSLHSLRHDCATFLITSNKVPLTVVSKQMRHSSTQLTADTYSHLLKTQETLASDTMGDIWTTTFADGEDVAV